MRVRAAVRPAGARGGNLQRRFAQPALFCSRGDQAPAGAARRSRPAIRRPRRVDGASPEDSAGLLQSPGFFLGDFAWLLRMRSSSRRRTPSLSRYARAPHSAASFEQSLLATTLSAERQKSPSLHTCARWRGLGSCYRETTRQVRGPTYESKERNTKRPNHRLLEEAALSLTDAILLESRLPAVPSTTSFCAKKKASLKTGEEEGDQRLRGRWGLSTGQACITDFRTHQITNFVTECGVLRHRVHGNWLCQVLFIRGWSDHSTVPQAQSLDRRFPLICGTWHSFPFVTEKEVFLVEAEPTASSARRRPM